MIDEQRFESIWRQYGGSVLRFCRFTSGSPEEGEDIAAETFARLLVKGNDVPDAKIEAWLFTVARNLCVSHHRRKARWSLLSREIAAQSGETARREEQSDVLSMLGSLNQKDRLAVYLRIVEDRPFSDVARLLGTSEDAAKKRVYRALERLRRSMNEAAMTTSDECVGGFNV